MEKLGCLPDELLRRMDALHAQGFAAAGSHQIAELIAEFGLQHDEYEERKRVQDKDAERQARAPQPAWRRTPRR